MKKLTDKKKQQDILINLISEGIDSMHVSDNSKKSILIRGCDPEMGRRAIKLMNPILGQPEMVSVTNDDDLIKELKRKKWTVVHFAPGACRYDESNLPIPGGRVLTDGWGLREYSKLVRKHQGQDVKIIKTTDEGQIIPLLKKALKSN